jgi:hypothetical protein
MHELGPEPNFNESMYFNVYDPAKQVGGFFRLGNRANEGSGEMTVCLWLPNGTVAFMFRRPEVTTNERFDAAGLRFEVLEPFAKLNVAYDGKVVVLRDPLEMADPRAAFTSNPHVPCSVELTYAGLSQPLGGEPDTPSEHPGEEFARGHYEQLVAASGTVVVDDQSFEVSGFGLRDHSWGPRYWQAPWYYRWLTANFGANLGFMGSRIVRRHGAVIRGGFVWRKGEMHMCEDVQITSTWDPEHLHHRELKVQLSYGGEKLDVSGKVLGLIPLRNRRTDGEGNLLETRISEGLTEWTLDDGTKGYGLSEYLDQIVDGSPVGLDS